MTGLPFPSVRGETPPCPPRARVGLPDQLGRVARDLRVSVTDRCNLRCRYCMPAEGLPWLAKPEMLTDDELVRRDRGVRRPRDPADPADRRRAAAAPVPRRRRARAIAALEPRPRIAMTTNGIGLDRLAQPLADAGLDRVNVSLDTIDPTSSPTSPAATACTTSSGSQGRCGRGARARQGQRRRDARDQRPLGRRPAPVVPRPWLRAALHRADAAGRPARLGRLHA